MLTTCSRCLVELDARLQGNAENRAKELRAQAAELRADADRMDAQAARIEETWQLDAKDSLRRPIDGWSARGTQRNP